MINDNNEILRWMEALRSNGEKNNPSFILNFFLHINICNGIIVQTQNKIL